MKRELKFRAWVGDVGVAEMIYPKSGVFDEINQSYDYVEWMQYTGFKDRSDVDIYESDIVVYGSHYLGDHYFCGGNGMIEWDEGTWIIISSVGSYVGSLWDFINNNNIHIIGNIYENI